jgi:hypothetical protein
VSDLKLGLQWSILRRGIMQDMPNFLVLSGSQRLNMGPGDFGMEAKAAEFEIGRKKHAGI